MSPPCIALLGAGSWGTALAIQFAHRYPVWLWGRDPQAMAAYRAAGANPRYLPDTPFPANLQPTAELATALQNATDVMLAVPSHAFATTCARIAAHQPTLPRLSWATKGLDPDTRQLLSQVARHYFPHASLAMLTGPTFAAEVARGLPTAVTLAAPDKACRTRLAHWLHTKHFRVYTTDDLTGAQLGASCKNVMAIAAGIADGLGFGANARAALITRGLAEITRLTTALGGRTETLMGLAGLGDLTLTCTDNQSRNRRLGLALAQGRTMAQAKQEIGQAIEGIATTREIYHKARTIAVEMPITEQVYQVLYQGLAPGAAVSSLLRRTPGQDRRIKPMTIQTDNPCIPADVMPETAAISHLDCLSIIRVSGADAHTFLQGQLTNDIHQLGADRSQLSGYCTPKGRLLAIFRIVPDGDDLLLILPRELAASICKRLQLYVLRANVQLQNMDNTLSQYELAGPGIADIVPAPPDADETVVQVGDLCVIRLPGDRLRLRIIGPAAAVEAFRTQIDQPVQSVTADAWRLLDIRAGLPTVYAATREAFVPQMTNLHQVGGVSFKKGCYTGQEVVARMHYLGKQKKQLYRLQITDDQPVQVGQPLYAPEARGQTVGTIADQARSPAGGWEVLAVCQTNQIDQLSLTPNGSATSTIRLLSLPYTDPDSE